MSRKLPEAVQGATAFRANQTFQKREWLVQRVGWLLGLVGLVAAGFGYFGEERAISLVKAVAVYLFLLVVFRLAGKRTLTEVTTFDLILLLIISEATQNALVGQDDSLANAFIVVTTLVAINVVMSELKLRFDLPERVLDSVPLLIVDNGKPLEQCMNRERVDLDDVLEVARETHGIEKLEDIRFAVLERSGRISIIPYEQSKQG